MYEGNIRLNEKNIEKNKSYKEIFNYKKYKFKIKKIMFSVSLVYIFSYTLNYIYLNRTLHFFNWYCLTFILFCLHCLFLIDLKNILKVGLSYIIASLIIFFIKKLDINFVVKAIGNKLSETQFVVLLVIFIIDFLLKYKLYIKNKKDFRNKENLEEIYPDREKDKEYIINFLKNENNKNIHTLGIDSDFGTGKTFLINEVIKELDEESFDVIKIRCLLLEKEEIYLYILKKIKRILLKNLIFTTSFEKIRNTFIKTLDSKFFGGISDLLSPNISIDEIDYFKEVIGRLDKKIILIFDDIDRVQDTEKIERIFSFISDFSINNIRILVLHNSKNLKNIDKRYNRYYLEKYLPLTRKISGVSFVNLLKKEIKDRKLDEEDFKFLYVFEQEYYAIHKGRQKTQEEFKFIVAFDKIMPKDEKVYDIRYEEIIYSQTRGASLKNISPRMVKNFIEETLNYFSNFKDIDKRIIIAYTLLKHMYYEQFYEKIDNNKSFVELFPINLKFKYEEIKLSLQDLDVLKNIVSLKKKILANEYEYIRITDWIFEEINGINMMFDSRVYDKYKMRNHINYYLDKIKFKLRTNSIRERINFIEHFLENSVEYDIEEENIIIYILFDYPLYFENDNEVISEKIERIERGIKKLNFFGNKEYLSEKQKFYNLFLLSLKKKNLKIIFDDFIKLTNSSNRSNISPYTNIKVMQTLRVLGTIEEQEKFLKMTLIQEKNVMTDTYIRVFLDSAISNKKISDGIVNCFLKGKVRIEYVDTVEDLITNIDRIFLRISIRNVYSSKYDFQQYLEDIKKEILFNKKICLVRKTRIKYIKFIMMLLEALDFYKH